jgi:hypothetical protein
VRKLFLYAAGVCGILAALEVAFRVFEPEIAASANRVTAKVALLQKQGRVDALFLGTSRFWDAIAPRQFAARFPGMRGFSIAASGARLETLETLAERFAQRPGLRVAFVEVSPPQLDPRRTPAEAMSGIEALAAHSLKLVEHRAVLRGESLLRLPELLLYPRSMDGSETRLVDQLAAVLGQRPDAQRTFEVRPEPVTASASTPDPRAERMAAVGRAFRHAGAQVIFVLPPVRGCEGDEDTGAVAAWLARDSLVWDYRTAPLPQDAWRDCSHLNARGRAVFSGSLAEETARGGWLRSVADRSH